MPAGVARPVMIEEREREREREREKEREKERERGGENATDDSHIVITVDARIPFIRPYLERTCPFANSALPL